MASVNWDYHSYRHKVRYQVQEGRKIFRSKPRLHLIHRTFAYDPSWYELFGFKEPEQVLKLLQRAERLKRLQGIALAHRIPEPPPFLSQETRYLLRLSKKKVPRRNRIQKHHMVPVSRGGSNAKQNLLRLKAGRHAAWHDLFDTNTWQEVIASLSSIIQRQKTLEQAA